MPIFQSTRPLRGGTPLSSYTTPPLKFQSTRPLRGGTQARKARTQSPEFQSTRPLRGGTRADHHDQRELQISIHPPLAGRDTSLFVGFAFCSDFNPPAPCGAGPLIRYWAQMEMQFQSTRPLRGGTDLFFRCHNVQGFQSTRPLRGGTVPRPAAGSHGQFQSTRPLRGGTVFWRVSGAYGCISIHPPLAGRDPQHIRHAQPGMYFNPPAPCGAGPSEPTGGICDPMISIHPPLAGRDLHKQLDPSHE